MSTRIIKFIAIIFFMGVFSCNQKVSNHKFFDYVSKNRDTMKVNIPYEIIPELSFDQQSPPLVTCLREKYARLFFNSEMHLENIVLRDFYGNFINPDTIAILSDQQMIDLAKELFQPLFKESKTGASSEADLWNKHLLSKNLEVNFVLEEESNNRAVFLENNQYRWFLTKTDNRWKIIDIENVQASM